MVQRDKTPKREEPVAPREDEYSTTDDDRAREAAEHPLKTAATPQPTPRRSGRVGWGAPAAMVAIAIAVLLLWVFW